MSSEAKRSQGSAVPPKLGVSYVLLIFGFALCVRALHLWQISEAPFFSLLMGDSEAYHRWALKIAGGDWLGDRVFYQAPLYPYFMGSLYALLQEAPWIVKVSQLLLGSASCLLLAGAGVRLFSLRVGIVAGLLLALYAPAIFFDGLIQKSALDLFFVCLLLWWIAALRWRPSAGLWVAAGGTLAALILTRENALVLLLPVGAWAAFAERGTVFRRLAPAFYLALGLSLILLPVAMRNLAVGGEFHLTTSQFGTNFYIGNNPTATGGYQPLRYGRGNWKFEQQDATELAEQALGRALGPGEVSNYWRDRALAFIESQPCEWLGLLSRKALLLANAVESVDTEDLYTHAEWSWPLRTLGGVLHFGVIVPLALLGLIVSWQRRRSDWLLLALPAVYAASVVSFYVFARYRYPLVPFLLLFAAVGLVGARGFVRERSSSATAFAICVLLGSAVLCNWPLASQDQMRSATHRNIGVALREQGDMAAARAQFERSLGFDPQNPLTNHSMGVLLYFSGELEASARYLRVATKLKPKHAPSHARLGMTLSRLGHSQPALSHYRRALELDPQLAFAHYNLGLNLIVLGRVEEAKQQLSRSVVLDPKNRGRLADRALTAATSKQQGRAAQESLRLAHFALEFGEAESAIVLDALAAAYAANGEHARALETSEAALVLVTRDAGVSAEREGEMRARLERYRSER